MSERYPKPIVDFLKGEPTPEQWTAISWPLEPSVVVAGAGSGKTSVMAARRSEERRVGKECSLLCRSRWSPYH